MDPKRFDALARSLARSGSRRRLLGGLAAGSLAPLGTAAKANRRHDDGPEPAKCLPVGKRCSQPAAEADRHGKGKRKHKGKHHPPSCSKCCSRFGAAGSDGKARCSCKGEGIACDNPSQCCSGDCRDGNCTACPPNTVSCPDGCANLQTDPNHCGSCDKACANGQRCVGGSCVCDGTSCPNGCCDADAACQRGTSNQACGNGGATCQTCTGDDTCGGGGTDGVCGCTPGTTCPPGQTCGTAPDGCGDTLTCTGCAGCCAGNICDGGMSDDACGKNGAECADCVQSSQVCFDQACCTPDCSGTCDGEADGCGGTCGCPAGQFCAGGTCVDGQGTCASGADFCANPSASTLCDGRDDCFCRITTEGDTRCGGNAVTGTCGGCASTAECEASHPEIAGVFCLKGGTGCCDSTAPRGGCIRPCPS